MIDIGYVAPILALLILIGFIVALSIFQVWWQRIWGDHDAFSDWDSPEDEYYDTVEENTDE